MKIVIARYNESINWTKGLKKVIIYNKGNDELDTKHKVKKLKNVGREGHTFYNYIYKNYNKLDDYTFFLQGNPFDHCSGILEYINNFNNMKHKPDFCFLTNKQKAVKLINCKYHSNLNLFETYVKIFNNDKVKRRKLFKFGPGGQFVVKKEIILKRPREFYKNIADILSYSVNPIEGFCVERFHGLIFS